MSTVSVIFYIRIPSTQYFYIYIDANWQNVKYSNAMWLYCFELKRRTHYDDILIENTS